MILLYPVSISSLTTKEFFISFICLFPFDAPPISNTLFHNRKNLHYHCTLHPRLYYKMTFIAKFVFYEIYFIVLLICCNIKKGKMMKTLNFLLSIFFWLSVWFSFNTFIIYWIFVLLFEDLRGVFFIPLASDVISFSPLSLYILKQEYNYFRLKDSYANFRVILPSYIFLEFMIILFLKLIKVL